MLYLFFARILLMQPNQPVGSPSPAQNPYDFITNPGTPPKKSLFGGGSTKNRVFVVAIGILVLIILATVVMSLLSSAGNGSTSALKSLVSQQEEIIRISELGTRNAKGIEARALAITTSLSVKTQQNEMVNYLSSKSTEVSKEELAAEKDTKIDATFEDATTNNRFDEVFTETLLRKLATYTNLLESTHKDAGNDKAQAVLKSSYISASTLLKGSEE